MSVQKIDSNLITRVIRQERSAQFQLFESTKGLLFSICYRVLTDEDEANDVLQDAYVEIFQNIRKLENPEALISWMKTITIRKQSNIAKSKFGLSR
ncbi:sigma factor [Algoriphagus sp.]|uniref:RNA polymerase sigma factor n=1 Tax=Algoriphagus sp. TaxID=1872435 RepID=UPI0025CE18D7|nr:sigma factor [Algoriphagus sp.]